MNFGKKILELRKSKNVKQEELAAELGVTAAAVSKWENNYTLPDLYMLCALADYFEVTTDALLGREKPAKRAVVAACTQDLGEKIKAVTERFGIAVTSVYTDLEAACDAVRHDEAVNYLLVAYLGGIQNTNTSLDWGERSISLYMDLSNSENNVLSGVEEFLRIN